MMRGRGLLLLALVTGIDGGFSALGSDDPVKDTLDRMIRDSGVYYVPEGLPGRTSLLDALTKQSGDFWQALSPLQSFFVLETAPAYLQKAPREVAQAAYCAAMEALPGDWWGPYGRPDSDTSRRLLQIDGIDHCLLRQLDNEKRVQMGDSEPATLAKLETFQVGDLAALLLSARHGLEYPIHDSLQDRKARRGALKKRLEQQAEGR